MRGCEFCQYIIGKKSREFHQSVARGKKESVTLLIACENKSPIPPQLGTENITNFMNWLLRKIANFIN